MKGFTTKALHTEFLKKDAHGALHMPVYDCSAFEFDSSEEIELAFKGKKTGHMYSRITNPTVEHFEQKVKNITDAFSVLALSSGMAAIANLIIAVCQSGDNIITTKYLFGNTSSLFEKTLKPWGLQIKHVDMNKPDLIEQYIDDKTKIIFLETITNPQLEVADIDKISQIAKRNGKLLVVDSSLTPFYFCSLKKHGVDIEVLSCTKYISGGATSIGGLIVDYGTYDWSKNNMLFELYKQHGQSALIIKLKRESYRNFGSCLSPHNAYLQSLGLETLGLRAEKTCMNALEISKFLNNHPKVKSVNYPGLVNTTYHKNAKSLLGNLFGGLLTFDLSSKDECFKFMNQLKIIRRATNFNDNKSLIIHPSSTIFCEFDETAQLSMGIKDTMMRLSAGIEDIEDLIEDIKQALENI